MVAFSALSKDYCVIMGKTNGLSPTTLTVIKCLIQENIYTQHEIAKENKTFVRKMNIEIPE